jgi:very-short-patch-repair endonuclease
MATAFQATAFQNNAFQIGEVVEVDLGEVTLELTFDLSGRLRIIRRRPVGGGISGRAWDNLPRLKPRSNMPAMPKPPKPPKIELRTYEPLETEMERTEARWRAWQASPEAAGKGSASILEFMAWEFLVYKKKQIEDVDFIYQYPLAGGRTQFGGFVADFFFPARNLVWNPAGLQFHWTKPEHRGRDILATQVLGARGIKVIYLWEDDMLQRPDYTLEKAWQGEQIPGRI